MAARKKQVARGSRRKSSRRPARPAPRQQHDAAAILDGGSPHVLCWGGLTAGAGDAMTFCCEQWRKAAVSPKPGPFLSAWLGSLPTNDLDADELKIIERWRKKDLWALAKAAVALCDAAAPKGPLLFRKRIPKGRASKMVMIAVDTFLAAVFLHPGFKK